MIRALLVSMLFLAFGQAFAQQAFPVANATGMYYSRGGLRGNVQLVAPTTRYCIPYFDSAGSMVVEGGLLYYHDGTGWVAVGGGSGTVTSVGLVAGTGTSIAGASPITGAGTWTVTNTAPDQTVVLNNGLGISVSGTYPTFTVTNSSPSSGGTVTSVTPVAGTSIGITTNSPTTAMSFTVTNTAPDQTVALNNGIGVSVSGTYPTFTVTNTSPSSGGTVTSVGLASTSTITITGTTSPITTSGTYSVSIPSSVALPGSPTTTTPSAGDNSTKIPTTAYVYTGYARIAAVTTVSATTYTLTAADIGNVISCTNGSAVTITVPSGLGSAFYCTIQQDGAGQVTATAGAGVTLKNPHSYTKTFGNGGNFSVLPTHTTDIFSIQGDMQ